MNNLVLAIGVVATLVIAIGLYVPIRTMLSELGLSRLNYRSAIVISGGGIFIFTIFLMGVALTALVGGIFGIDQARFFLHNNAILLFMLLGGVGMIGLLDDLDERGRVKGMSGHLRALFKGRLTSGMLKAMLGLILSFLASAFVSSSATEHILNTVLLALSINLFNILDLRPGRAIKVFLLAIALIYLAGSALNIWPLILLICVPVLIFLIADLKEYAMLGDAGSNLLGAVIGLLLVLVTEDPAKIAIILVFAAIELAGDTFSLTRIIEANPILNYADKLGRIKK